MTRVLLVLSCLSFVLAGAVAWADRTDVILRSSLSVRSVTISDDGAGACQVVVCATATSADAGLSFEKCHGPISLSGQANTECLGFMNTRGRNLFIAQERL